VLFWTNCFVDKYLDGVTCVCVTIALLSELVYCSLLLFFARFHAQVPQFVDVAVTLLNAAKCTAGDALGGTGCDTVVQEAFVFRCSGSFHPQRMRHTFTVF
jgi:hypothetical protein